MPSFYRVRMPNYVTQRSNGIYEIRYPIPVDVQSFYPKSDGTGLRKQIVKSLSTRDPKEAKAKEVQFISELEAEFQVLRGDVDKDRVEAILLRMYAGVLNEFDKERIDKGLSIDDPLYGVDAKRLNLAIFLGSKGDDQRDATVDVYVRQVLFELGVAKDPCEIEESSSLYQTIKPIVISVLVDIYRTQIARLEGLPDYEPENLFLRNEAAHNPTSKTRKSNAKETGLTVGKHFSSYLERLENTSEPIKDRTLNRRKKALQHFASWVGEATFLSEIGKTEAWEFHDALLDLPCRSNKIHELKDLTFKDQIRLSRRKKEWQSIKAATAADLMRHVGAAFVDAEKRGLIDSNPTQGAAIKIPKSERRTKRSFSPEELRKIFVHDDFSAVQCPEDADDLFWVPILMLCTGSRTSELFLRLDEVHLEGKYPYISLDENEARTLKTSSSKRTVPIHPVIMQLGFDRYIKKRKSQGDKWLFPKWNVPKSGIPSDSKRRQRFNTKILVEVGVKEPAVSAHCFRHNFETALSEKGIPERLANRLSGESLKGRAEIYTEANLDVGALYEELEKLNFSDALNGLLEKHSL